MIDIDDMDLNEPITESTTEVAAAAVAPVEENDEGRSSQRDKLIACAADAKLWHDADGTGYATLAVREHEEHHLLRSKGFKDWLRYRFYKATKGAAGAQAMQDAIATLDRKSVV